MTVVHNEPHPLAQKYVKPSNAEISRKFGIVRVEDWDDRVGGDPWLDRYLRGGFPEADQYEQLHNQVSPIPMAMLEVVRCHTQSTGELVLLHDDWLKDAQIIA